MLNIPVAVSCYHSLDLIGDPDMHPRRGRGPENVEVHLARDLTRP